MPRFVRPTKTISLQLAPAVALADAVNAGLFFDSRRGGVSYRRAFITIMDRLSVTVNDQAGSPLN